MNDKNNRTVQIGDIVQVENSPIKSSNGLYVVVQDGTSRLYSDTKNLTMYKVAQIRNGRYSLSKTKYNICFFPLTNTSNKYKYTREQINAATIEIIEQAKPETLTIVQEDKTAAKYEENENDVYYAVVSEYGNQIEDINYLVTQAEKMTAFFSNLTLKEGQKISITKLIYNENWLGKRGLSYVLHRIGTPEAVPEIAKYCNQCKCLGESCNSADAHFTGCVYYEKLGQPESKGNQAELRGEVKKTLDFLAETDKEIYGAVTPGTMEAYAVQGEKLEEDMLKRTYYTINETQARQAKSMWSFSEYVKDSETTEYISQVDEVYTLGEKAIKNGADVEKVRYLCDRFAKQYAEWKNKGFTIELMCPSVMISGAGNFPVRKKEKQNAARDNHMKEYNRICDIKGALEHINSGSNIIKSDDDDAIDKLKDKLSALKQNHEAMKNANAYYRKNKTLDGFDGLSEELKSEVMEQIKKYSWITQPFGLSNSLQNIKSVEERIKTLEKTKQQGNKETENDFFKVKEDTELMRLQLFFDGKPSEQIRSILKSNGYKWSPTNMAWQRQLTNNARYSVKRVIDEISKIS